MASVLSVSKEHHEPLRQRRASESVALANAPTPPPETPPETPPAAWTDDEWAADLSAAAAALQGDDNVLARAARELDAGAATIAGIEVAAATPGQGHATGLVNGGATCFLNAVLQLLAALSCDVCEPIFDAATRGVGGALVRELALLLARLRACRRRAIRTNALTEAMGWGLEERRQQADSHEALRLLVDVLVDSGVNLSALQGEVVDALVCDVCGAARRRTDKVMDVVVSTGDGDEPWSVAKGLELFSAAEVLDGDNAVWCDACSKRSTSAKSLAITKPPTVLFVVIARFEVGPDGRRKKLSKRVSYEATIAVGAADDYCLVGVLAHIGTAVSGHYVSFTKPGPAPGERLPDWPRSGTWLSCDDATVSVVDEDKVMTFAREGGGSTPYILVYRRMDPNASGPAAPLPAVLADALAADDKACARAHDAIALASKVQRCSVRLMHRDGVVCRAHPTAHALNLHSLADGRVCARAAAKAIHAVVSEEDLDTGGHVRLFSSLEAVAAGRKTARLRLSFPGTDRPGPPIGTEAGALKEAAASVQGDVLELWLEVPASDNPGTAVVVYWWVGGPLPVSDDDPDADDRGAEEALEAGTVVLAASDSDEDVRHAVVAAAKQASCAPKAFTADDMPERLEVTRTEENGGAFVAELRVGPGVAGDTWTAALARAREVLKVHWELAEGLGSGPRQGSLRARRADTVARLRARIAGAAALDAEAVRLRTRRQGAHVQELTPAPVTEAAPAVSGSSLAASPPPPPPPPPPMPGTQPRAKQSRPLVPATLDSAELCDGSSAFVFVEGGPRLRHGEVCLRLHLLAREARWHPEGQDPSSPFRCRAKGPGTMEVLAPSSATVDALREALSRCLEPRPSPGRLRLNIRSGKYHGAYWRAKSTVGAAVGARGSAGAGGGQDPGVAVRFLPDGEEETLEVHHAVLLARTWDPLAEGQEALLGEAAEVVVQRKGDVQASLSAIAKAVGQGTDVRGLTFGRMPISAKSPKPSTLFRISWRTAELPPGPLRDGDTILVVGEESLRQARSAAMAAAPAVAAAAPPASSPVPRRRPQPASERALKVRLADSDERLPTGGTGRATLCVCNWQVHAQRPGESRAWRWLVAAGFPARTHLNALERWWPPRALSPAQMGIRHDVSVDRARTVQGC